MQEKNCHIMMKKNGISNIALSLLNKYDLSINTAFMDDNEIELCIKDLKKLLKHTTNLEYLNIYMFNSKDAKSYTQCDMSFLDELNSKIKIIHLQGIDLSNENSSLFSKFNEILKLSLHNCNIHNPELVSDINSSAYIELLKNNIDPMYANQMNNLIIKHKGKIKTSDSKFNEISQIYERNIVKISEYSELMNKINFSEIKDLKIEIDDNFDKTAENVESIIDSINNLQNATIVSSAQNYISISERNPINLPAKLIIKNVSELSTMDIEKFTQINSIEIEDGLNTVQGQRRPYTREEYLKIRKTIDKLIERYRFRKNNSKTNFYRNIQKVGTSY